MLFAKRRASFLLRDAVADVVHRLIDFTVGLEPRRAAALPLLRHAVAPIIIAIQIALMFGTHIAVTAIVVLFGACSAARLVLLP